MRQRLPADDYDHRALLVMALEREQPGCTIHQVLRQRSRPAGDSPRGWGVGLGHVGRRLPRGGRIYAGRRQRSQLPSRSNRTPHQSQRSPRRTRRRRIAGRATAVSTRTGTQPKISPGHGAALLGSAAASLLLALWRRDAAVGEQERAGCSWHHLCLGIPTFGWTSSNNLETAAERVGAPETLRPGAPTCRSPVGGKHRPDGEGGVMPAASGRLNLPKRRAEETDRAAGVSGVVSLSR